MKFATIALALAALAASIIFSSGCAITVQPGGATTFTSDPDAIIRTLEILDDK